MLETCIESSVRGVRIQHQDCLLAACEAGQLKIVKYLLELKKYGDRFYSKLLFALVSRVDEKSEIRLEIFKLMENYYEIWPCLRDRLMSEARRKKNNVFETYL